MLRALIIPNELPVPPNSGGRIDVWRRLELLHRLGAQTALLTWYDEPRDGLPSDAQRAQLAQVCATTLLTPIRRSPAELLRRLLRLGRLPSHAASRWVSLDRPAVLAWARAFRPGVVVLDGLYGVAVARWLARELGVPWVYRAHNVEHHYMQVQLAQSRRWKTRLGLLATVWGLERLERAAVADARQVLDISTDDAAFWRRQGCQQVQWLPTLVDPGFVGSLAQASQLPAQWDILYFGNLNTPNNVQAVRWLVQCVLPHLPAEGLRVAVAGSRPSPELKALLLQDKRVQLLADPADMADVAGRARVLVNPVQGGSGVNLKNVEMLFTQAWLVSTTAGVRGLPVDACACFAVHDTPEGFAGAVADALHSGPLPPATQVSRQASARPFTHDHAQALLLAALTDQMASPARPPGHT